MTGSNEAESRIAADGAQNSKNGIDKTESTAYN